MALQCGGALLSTAMTKSQGPVLLLTDEEKAALKRAKLRIRDLGDHEPEHVVEATRGVMTLDRARESCAHVALYAVDGIGNSLAYSLWLAGLTHPRQLVGLSAQAVAARIEMAQRREVDDNYLRSLQIALDGVTKMFGAADAAESNRQRLKTRVITAPKAKVKPLPGGTKRAEVLKRPYIATLDQVRITRDGDTAIIEYAEEGVVVTHFRFGPKLSSMTDEEVLESFNDGIAASEEHRRGLDLPAIEIPVGKPQVEWSERARQWSARGHVLRCIIRDDEERMPRVIIDDKDLSWEQFGRLVVSFAGWGARIVFVADDELDEGPHIEVREPHHKTRER
jgi:hypothetical protein